MARKNFRVDEVIRTLSRKRDCKIDADNNKIFILSNDLEDGSPNTNKSNDLGNGSWAKIGFLVRYNGWKIEYVDKFKKEGKR